MGDVSVIARRLLDGHVQYGWSGNGGCLDTRGVILNTLNGDDVSVAADLLDHSDMLRSGPLLAEPQEHQVARSVSGPHKLPMCRRIVHQSAAGRGLAAAVKQLRSACLPEYPPLEHHAPRVFSGGGVMYFPPIVGGIVLYVVAVRRGFLYAEL